MLFAGLEAGLDGAPLEILVNNAGVLDFTRRGRVAARLRRMSAAGSGRWGKREGEAAERAAAQPM
jgi:hypothetical protein